MVMVTVVVVGRVILGVMVMATVKVMWIEIHVVLRTSLFGDCICRRLEGKHSKHASGSWKRGREKRNGTKTF